MKKQTAMEWLEDAMFSIIHVCSIEDYEELRSMVRYAKTMEEEHIIDFTEGYLDWVTDKEYNTAKEAIIDYYNKTYNNTNSLPNINEKHKVKQQWKFVCHNCNNTDMP